MVGTYVYFECLIGLRVLIPLKSGHGWHLAVAKKRVKLAKVLIPLKSGHGWHVVGEQGTDEAGCLNPFEIRAWLARLRQLLRQPSSPGLNPFEIRAWLARGILC